MVNNNPQKENNSWSCKKNSIICCCISVGVVILLFFSCCFVCKYFACHLQTDEVFDTSHGLRFDEKLIAQIDSLDESGNYQDSVVLKQEVQQLKRLTQYVIERESNYQMEIDLIIDKYSQWTGYWLSVIGCVLTLFTLLQVFLNYRSNDDNTKKVDKSLDEFRQDSEKTKSRFVGLMGKLIRDTTLSNYQNKLSCISICLSSFPDAFSLTPNAERQKFIRIFVKMLHEEYSDYTNEFERLKNCKHKTNRKTDLYKQMGYVYFVWCDISVAVNHAMYDFTKPEQNVAFDTLKSKLCIAITMYHNNEINEENICTKMHEILNAMDGLLRVL